VSNLERVAPDFDTPECAESEVVVLQPREVPLGGPRAILVRRTLPHRERRMVGAWCFVDHYGPVDLTLTEGMRVPPHPHTGLQTVSWLVDGAILHTDSLGSEVEIHPGQLNLMTAGRGISHAEDSLPEPATLHGIQLWVALPDGTRHQEPHFEHHADLPRVCFEGGEAIVFMGRLLDVESPAATYTPLVGAEIRLRPSASITIPVEPGFEYAVLVVDGEAHSGDHLLPRHALTYMGRGQSALTLAAPDGALLLLLGGEPFNEQIVMWWNFIGRDHEEITRMREDWQGHDPSFGTVEYHAPRLEAPELPNTRLKPRGSVR
jgi:redox-sensitive bicupin YhaK (pirin superfamily)